MHDLNRKELEIFQAIEYNYRMKLEEMMANNSRIFYDQKTGSPLVESWVNEIYKVRSLTDSYLHHIAQSPRESTNDTIEANTTIGSYFSRAYHYILPEKVTKAIAEVHLFKVEQNLLHSITKVAFSAILGQSFTDLLVDYFVQEYDGDIENAQQKFKEVIKGNTQFSRLIQAECERHAVELIKLFHFREMLLLGKLGETPLEPDARANFISHAKLEKARPEDINAAIEIYFTRELSNLFMNSFKSLYKVQDYEIHKEQESPLLKWLSKTLDKPEKRMAFTQKNQLAFMQFAKNFLLDRMNQPGFLGKHPIISSIIAGLATLFLLSSILSLLLNPIIVLVVAVVGAVLSGIGTHILIKLVDFFAYRRNAVNRSHIQESINRIDNEYLALDQHVLDTKATSKEDIKNAGKFEEVNRNLGHLMTGNKVARGAHASWFREYASRYCHNKAIEVDLGEQYTSLIVQSKKQNAELINAINNKHFQELDAWISGTKVYLQQDQNKEFIQQFELIQKFKEQVLEIISQVDHIPNSLQLFYSLPINKGGLGGNATELACCRRIVPNKNQAAEHPNPYHNLCNIAGSLFKKQEFQPRAKYIFDGDNFYRGMLGIAKAPNKTPINEATIDKYLETSYTFLLSLCTKVTPGVSIDPLIQQVIVTDDFILYRMLLLKQLASLCTLENTSVTNEVKESIKNFVKKRFNLDPQVVFDDLNNQKFLLNREVQTSLMYTNSNGIPLYEVALENITQAICLDLAYNAINFKLTDVLQHYIDKFKEQQGRPQSLFACNQAEQELNPLSTKEYISTVRKYCRNTKAFLDMSESNEALTTTNIITCYRYNVSLQVYRTQLRIIEALQVLANTKADAIEEQSTHLLTAFNKLEAFAQKYCYALEERAALRQMAHFIHDKIDDKTPFRKWAKELDEPHVMLGHLNNLPTEFVYPVTFFAPKQDKKTAPVLSTAPSDTGWDIVPH